MSPIVEPRNVSLYLDVSEVRAIRALAGAADFSMATYLRQVVLDHIASNPDAKKLAEKAAEKPIRPAPSGKESRGIGSHVRDKKSARTPCGKPTEV